MAEIHVKPFIYGSSKAAIEKLAKDLSTFLPNINGRINVLSLAWSKSRSA